MMPLSLKGQSRCDRMFTSSKDLYQDPAESARHAGLRYVSDEQPGIRRQRWGRGFSYFDTDSTRIQDPKRRARFETLVIPPSWEDVWICKDVNGHLQATGRDQRGRKQYRYHPDWVKLRNQLKFDRLIPSAQALPTLREITQQQTRTATLDRETVIAAIVQLLDHTLIRIGNLEYSQTNGSYGLTTLRDRHVDIAAGVIKLQFRGKSGVDHEIDLQNRRLAKIVKQCKEIPGHTLFQYLTNLVIVRPLIQAISTRICRQIWEKPLPQKTFASGVAPLRLAKLSTKWVEPWLSILMTPVLYKLSKPQPNSWAIAPPPVASTTFIRAL